MTTPTRISVGNLIGGVSQLPVGSRSENQCEVQDNGYVHIADGLGKRPPTEHVRYLHELDGIDLEGAKVHWINRDSTERYLVIVTPNSIDGPVLVFDANDGTQMTVVNDADVTNYLYSGVTDHSTQIKALTIADVTYFVNTQVTVQKDATATLTDSWNGKSKSSRRGFLFLRATNYLTKYAVRLHTYTGTNPSHPDTDTWDPPVDAFTHPTDGPLTKEKALKRATAHVKTFSGDYANPQGNNQDVPPYHPAGGLYSGKQIPFVQANAVLERLYAEGYEPSPPTHQQNHYWGGIDHNYTARHQLGEPFSRILPNLLRLNAVEGTTQLFPKIVQSVMKLELRAITNTADPEYRESIRLQVPDDGGHEGGGLIAFVDEVPRITDLPDVCEHGHVVKVSGLEEEIEDDYYVEFVCDDIPEDSLDAYPADNMGRGHWRESTAPLTNPKLWDLYMPMKMTRVVDGGEPNGFKFVLSKETWADKACGDDESNPDPSFVGKEIQDLFFWKNRLGFLAGSRIVMSEADVYNNFWRTSVRSLLDSDPIDLDPGHVQPVDLRHAVPLDEELVIFSDRTQFVMTGDPILTPRTASVLPVTYFDALPEVRPEPSQSAIFFPFQSGGGAYSQVHEWGAKPDVEGYDVFPVSEHVPRYVAGKVVEMTSSSLESVLALRSDDAQSKHVVWIFKWIRRGAQRLLASWMRFTTGTSTTTEVLSVRFMDDALMMLTSREGSVVQRHLEKLVLTGNRQPDVFPGPGDTTTFGTFRSAFRCLLDRRVTERDCTITYDTTARTLDIRLPYLMEVGADTEIVTRNFTGTGPEGETLEHTREDVDVGGKLYTVLSVPDDKPTGSRLYDLWNATDSSNLLRFFVGQKYLMTYQFSEVTRRQRKSDGGLYEVNSGRLQLLRGHLTFEDSGYLRVLVAPALHSTGAEVVDMDTSTYHLPLLEADVGSSHLGDVNIRDGKIEFGIYTRPEYCRLIVENDSPYPSNLSLLEVEAWVADRSRVSST